jgi:hypothetical protein
MNKVHKLSFITGIALLVSAISSFGQSWRAVQDANGWTWARVTLVNQSGMACNWAVWNCRAAVDSTATAANTDADLNWDGVLNPGETRYVWLYVMYAADGIPGGAHIASAGGGQSGYSAAYAPSLAGDGEWVITVASDGTVAETIATGATYTAPTSPMTRTFGRVMMVKR